MKKICFVTTVPGTLQSFVLPTVKQMHESGEFDISFICTDDEKFSGELPEYIHYLPVRMKRGINLYGIKATYEMYKIFKREKFDLVQYSTPNASLYASLASKFAKIPVRLYCQWGIVYVGFSGIKRKIFKTIEKTVCKLSSWVEPDSFGNLKFSRSEGLYDENKSSVVWNGSASGVNTERFDISKKVAWCDQIKKEYGIPENAFVFGFVGRVTRDKGVFELFEAFEKISQTRENVYLLMIGRKETQDNAPLEAEKNPRIVFTGNVNDPERYYAAMNVFVLPSYREGFGSSVIEAEAMGLPVIVTDIPGPVDAMSNGNTGVTVKKADADELMSAMLEMYDNAELREKFASSSREFVMKKFEQKQLVSHIIEDRKRLMGISK